ncbi:carbon-nitrogen hydrolase family protein [Lichenibacterium dinghuense]|uniref:carbon-nitrogen hydrolase family protein n=1 Tax=Lichenibacterium dinghuense TaxID=2895977 RepID=UPI001F2BA25D|nr:carbon-nitrogen hydrolase family protein [Lichenibacterium sp. 6Y81]
MKVALIQMNSGHDRAANLRQAAALIERAVAEERPDWVLLPECFDFLGGTREAKFAAADRLPDGEAYAAMAGLARRHGVFIHAGSMLERLPGGERIGNTAVAFDRSGREVARYRKIHLFDITAPDGTEYRESASFAPGEAVATYDCEGVTVGCSICYDIRFPFLYQALMDRGARLIAVPAAFTMQTGKDHWEVLLRARAIETECYVAAAAQTGTFAQGGQTRTTYGHSMLVDPWGLVTARASDGVGIAAGRVEPERVERVRAMIPVAQHRRNMPRE